MAKWEPMIRFDPEQADAIAQALLLCCKRDIHDIVGIYCFLPNQAAP